MHLPVTILYGSLTILVTILLALNISLYRMRNPDASHAQPVPGPLHRRVRAHGNSAEWLAVTVLLLAFLELQGAPSLWLHLLGGAMLLARILHSTFMLLKRRTTVLSATVIYALSLAMAAWALVLRLH